MSFANVIAAEQDYREDGEEKQGEQSKRQVAPSVRLTTQAA
jgi:hypothetical protein